MRSRKGQGECRREEGESEDEGDRERVPWGLVDFTRFSMSLISHLQRVTASLVFANIYPSVFFRLSCFALFTYCPGQDRSQMLGITSDRGDRLRFFLCF